jgi:stage II sporulation protein D
MKSTSLSSILLIAAVFLTPVASGSSGPALRNTVRIKLLETFSPREAAMTAGQYGIAVYQSGQSSPKFQIGPGATFRVVRRGNKIQLEAAAGRVNASEVRLEPLGPGEIQVEVKSERRSYVGSLWITAPGLESELEIVNHVPLEEYVASVVSSEYGLQDLEGSKAMAVVARTYGLRSLLDPSARYDHVDHTGSQVYKGTRAVTPLARKAANATAGEVLTHSGRLIEAVYSSSSGGHTANNEDVWQSSPHPYLRGKVDPWDSVSPNHRWEVTIESDKLHRTLENALGLKLKRVNVAERGADGRAIAIGLEPKRGRTRTIPADEFRRILRSSLGEKSLKSTRFDLDQKRGRYVFKGSGFGHGVGMSQYGAHGMALAGKSYTDIVHFYYSGVRLERRQIEGSALPPAGLLASSRPPGPTIGASSTDRLRGRFMPGRTSRGGTRPAAADEITAAVVPTVAPTRRKPRARKPDTSKPESTTERRRGW